MLGAALQLTIIRPTMNKPPLNAVIVTIGLLILLEGLAGIFYGGQYRSFPAAFSIIGLKVGTTPLGVSRYDVFVAAAVLVTTLVLAVAFKYTTAGLRMRAAAFNATIARLSGIRVGAGAHRRLGAGGPDRRARGRARLAIDVPLPEQHGRDLRVRLHRGGDRRPGQPGGAVVGGLLLGVVLSYVGGYLGSKGSDLTSMVALGILVLVLMIRPGGLFSATRVRQV